MVKPKYLRHCGLNDSCFIWPQGINPQQMGDLVLRKLVGELIILEGMDSKHPTSGMFQAYASQPLCKDSVGKDQRIGMIVRFH